MRRSRVLAMFLFASLLPLAAHAQGKPPAAQVVDLKAGGGVTLKATYYPAGRPGPGILMLHACNKDRASWAQLATDAAAKGFHVLALDFRGFGESGGTRFNLGPEQQSTIDLYWPVDVDAALAWLTSQSGVDKARIGATGASCGVNQAVLLARRHTEVKTVVLLSGGVTAAARLHLRDSPGLPIFGAASSGDGGAVDQMRWVLGWSRNPDNSSSSTKPPGTVPTCSPSRRSSSPWCSTGSTRICATHPKNLRPSSPPNRRRPKSSGTRSPRRAASPRRGRCTTMPSERGRKRCCFRRTRRTCLAISCCRNGNAKDAVDVFKMNVEAYPSSANTYDSLSDAYLALGNTAEALRYAEQAIAMLAKDVEAPDNFKKLVRESAEKKIKELRKQ